MIDLRSDHGFDIPTAAKATKRVPCSACGMTVTCSIPPRSTVATTVVATGHNLDDEAAVLLGNTVRWEVEYLARQHPVLPARPGFPKKVKPLVRLTEREMAAWCVVRGIDYIVEECPMAVGNKHLGFKATLNEMEAASPGSKAAFYLGFLDRMSPLLQERSVAAAGALGSCGRCGAPTTSDICAFCRLSETAAAHEPVPVELMARAGRGRRKR